MAPVQAIPDGLMRAASKIKRFCPETTLKVDFNVNATASHLRADRVDDGVSLLVGSEKRAAMDGEPLTSHSVATFPFSSTFHVNRIVETYGRCGRLDDARTLFDEMPMRDGGSWTAWIMAYRQCGIPRGSLQMFRKMKMENVPVNDVTLVFVFGACADMLDGLLAAQVHGVLVRSGFSRNVILCSSLVDVYGKCGDITAARRMFDEIDLPNEVSWNVIVRRYLKAGLDEEAVATFEKMLQTGTKPLSFTFCNVLIACASIRALCEGMKIHGIIVKFGLEDDLLVANSLIDMYSKNSDLECASKMFEQLSVRDYVSSTSMISAYASSGRINQARELFNSMPKHNVISWNSMLGGYIRLKLWEEASDFIHTMIRTCGAIDNVSLGLILKVSASVLDIKMGKQIHGYVYRHGFDSSTLASNALLFMYGKCGNLRTAKLVFTKMSQRDRVSWNALLSSCTRHGQSEQAIVIFREMIRQTTPDSSTFGTLLAAVANVSELELGKQVHGFMIRHSYDSGKVLAGALVDMYSKSRCLGYAASVFRRSFVKDVVLWNSIILGCCHNRMGSEALKYFSLMLQNGYKPDHITFQGVLLACVKEGFAQLGIQYFSSMSSEFYITPRLEHYQCMVELFCRHGCLLDLENFLKEMPFKPTFPMATRIIQSCREFGWETLYRRMSLLLNEPTA